MAEIGRKIYYELSTGNVILDTGEREGDVVATTEAQDFALYTALQPYQQSAVGVLQLTYGEDASYFQQGYSYSVMSTQSPAAIQWGSAPTVSLAQAQATQKQLLEQGYQATLAAGFQATISAGTYTFGWRSSDIANMTALQMAINQTWQTFPVQYADVNGNPLSIASQTDLNTVEQTAQKFMTAQHQQVLSLIGQVQAATTVAGVNAIQWTAASY